MLNTSGGILVIEYDMDDTLLQNSEQSVHQPTWNKLFPEGGVNGISGIGVGMRPIEVIGVAAKHYGLISDTLPEDEQRQIIHGLEAQRQKIITDLVNDPNHGIELNPGALSLLMASRENGKKNVINTSGSLEYTQAVVRRFGLKPFIDFVVTGGLTDGTKPSTFPFDYTYNMLRRDIPQLKPRNIAFVGDSPNSDIKGARNAGFWAIGLETPHATASKLKEAGAHLVVSSLEQINPGPSGTFESYPFNNGFDPEGAALKEYEWLSTKYTAGKERLM